MYKLMVKRRNEHGDEYYDNYNVPADKASTVLEALLYIKENIDQTLSFRYSCRMEICGSCGMEINGRPRMACSTQLASLHSDIIKISPLPHYNVIKDLVVDFDPFFDKYKKVKPYIIRDDDGNYSAEIPQTPEQFNEFKGYAQCIKCGLCMAACPVVGTDENYLGPAPLTALFRYNIDNRDQGIMYRIDIANSDDGTSRCHFAGECTEACPKDVRPSFAIQKLRVQGLKYELKNIMGGKK
ncbi:MULTISPECIES: succinate dehydrogenase iron-sulfur subunit [Acidiplasma]|uniref:succinate dehydrogenase n=1 Tax=Acidiplasma aeolicum TaxID=507754 RepID=A0A0Q0VMH7_9ARCH|nr:MULTISPECIES: succinate dehydrogenase iron-sulfur subunit [Acidiplasma]KJE48638.1 succinate dehydrogenase [Acidiplasma sp. MBA-1]KQB34656.1 succinate dehydrogenase [Acidiplasma aeolicum]WMT55392.1 MAG: succinate dehydrogenase iron-sulfur subunit [Acidiplasma sp.]